MVLLGIDSSSNGSSISQTSWRVLSCLICYSLKSTTVGENPSSSVLLFYLPLVHQFLCMIEVNCPCWLLPVQLKLKYRSECAVGRSLVPYRLRWNCSYYRHNCQSSAFAKFMLSTVYWSKAYGVRAQLSSLDSLSLINQTRIRPLNQADPLVCYLNKLLWKEI